MKQKHTIANDKAKKNDIDEEVAKEIFSQVSKDLLDKITKRRLIVRQPSGEIVHEIPVLATLIATILCFIFFFPALIIAVLYGYHNKLQLEVIRDISEEDHRLAEVEHHDTIHGIHYDMDDGQATLIQ